MTSPAVIKFLAEAGRAGGKKSGPTKVRGDSTYYSEIGKLSAERRKQKQAMPKIAISILTHSALTLAKRCVESVLKHSGGNYVLILTANGNAEAEKYFRSVVGKGGPEVVEVVVNEKNEGFIAPNRRAFDIAVLNGAEFFVMLNDDMQVVTGWLEKLLEPFNQFPSAALSGPDGNCSHILANFHGTAGAFEYLEGSCLCCRVSVIQKLGLFPPVLSGAYGEDSSLSLRVREAGYSIHRVKLPMPHVRGATSATVPQAKAWQEANHNWCKKRFAHYLRVRYFEFPILIRRADAWGDVLLTTPIIRALRQRRPLSPIHIDTNCGDVFRDNPWVTKVGRGLPMPKDALVIDLNMAYENRTEVHIVDAYADKTRETLGGEFDLEDKGLDFYMRPADAPRTLYSPGGRVAVVHPGPVSWPGKEWGADKFNSVTKELLARGWKVFLVGSHHAAPITCTADFRGKTTVHQMAAIIAAGNLFIGLDSFPLHVAEAVGTNSIGLFGVTTAKYIHSPSRCATHNFIAINSEAPSAGLRHRTLNSKNVNDHGAAMAAITPAHVLELEMTK